MTDQLDRQIVEILGDARDEATGAHPWNDVLLRTESRTMPRPRNRQWARPLTVAASLILVLAVGIGIVARTGDEPGEVATSRQPIRLDVVPIDGVDAAGLRPLAEYTSFEDGDIVIPTSMFEGFEIQPLLVRQWNTEARAVSTVDDSVRIDLQVSRSMGDPREQADRSDVEASTELEIDGVSWIIDSFSDDLHFASTLFGEPDENARASGVVITASGIDVADLDTFLAGLRVGPADSYPEINYDVDAGAETVYEATTADLRLEFARIGQWNCWSLFEGTVVQATAGDCVAPTIQPDGALLLGSYARWPDDVPADSTQPIPSTGATAVTVGIVPAWAVGADVEYPGGRVDRVDVADLTGSFDAQFFVATGDVDGDEVSFADFADGESLTTVRAVYESEVSVVGVDVEPTGLRSLSELDEGSVAIPTVIVDGVEIEPLITRADGWANMIAAADDRRVSVSISTSGPLATRTDPVDRVVELQGVRWEIRIFQDLSFAQATIASRSVTVDSTGVTDDALDLVLAGLRAGSPDVFPEGTYDVDAGTDTVFRSADGGRSLEYLEMGRWRCWTVRDADGGALSGGCGDPDPGQNGAIVLDRFAIPQAGSDGDTIESTEVYTAGVLTSDAVGVDLEYGIGRIEQDAVDDLTDSFDARFFLARADFDGDVGYPETHVVAIIDPEG